MILDKIVVGSYAANCYIVADEETKEAIVIDPGAEPDKILKRIQNHELTVKKIILTHGHGDHIGAAMAIKESTGSPIAIHHNDAHMLEEPSKNLTVTMGKSISFSADETFGHKDEIKVGKVTCKILHTPGHTEGGVCVYFKKDRVLISGDTLFYGSVGRSDLAGGNHKTLIKSIQTELMSLDDETVVYPGHGSSTSIGFERRKNPFIQG